MGQLASPDCPDGYQELHQVPPFVAATTLPLSAGTGDTSGRFYAKVIHREEVRGCL